MYGMSSESEWTPEKIIGCIVTIGVLIVLIIATSGYVAYRVYKSHIDAGEIWVPEQTVPGHWEKR
jgi:hypothetical protein